MSALLSSLRMLIVLALLAFPGPSGVMGGAADAAGLKDSACAQTVGGGLFHHVATGCNMEGTADAQQCQATVMCPAWLPEQGAPGLKIALYDRMARRSLPAVDVASQRGLAADPPPPRRHG